MVVNLIGILIDSEFFFFFFWWFVDLYWDVGFSSFPICLMGTFCLCFVLFLLC